jgi:hypothetical protein
MRYPYVGPFRPETKYRCGLGQGSCIPLTWERSSIKVCWRPLRSAVIVLTWLLGNSRVGVSTGADGCAGSG